LRKQALAAVAALMLGAPMAVVLGAAVARASAAAKATPNGAVCNPKTAPKGIAAAFNQFLAAPSAAEKVKLVDQGHKVEDAVGKSTQVALTSGRETSALQDVAVNLEVTCTAKTKATFAFDLQLRQAATGVTTPPLGLRQPGAAVLRKGTWYVTALTVCGFEALNPDETNQPAVAECYQALGHEVPVPTT
jgi:hypothetical protein